MREVGVQPRAREGDREWIGSLERVIGDPSLVRPYFQAIVDLSRGVIAGYEILARFDELGGHAPSDWFDAAARLGYAESLDAAMLRIAAEHLAELPTNTFLTVNMSPGSAVSAEVREVLAEVESLEALVVELTEQTRSDDEHALVVATGRLRKLGALIAVDDVGSGYSSLHRILRIRPEFVKIDRAFVSEIHVDEAKAAATEMIGTLANRIDAWTIAEGVERVPELDRLIGLGVPLAQGFLFAKPSPQMEPLSSRWAVNLGGSELLPDDSLARLVEMVPAAPEEFDRGQLYAHFAADSSLNFLPLVDRRGRPVGLLERAVHLGAHPVGRPLMRVEFGTDGREALRRALVRDQAERLVPLIYCNAEGRYRGIVRVERLIDDLLD
jgi:EAL domain-containing protein (putative c-di-GMP-specific phosphodiesterase class I)